MCTRANIPVALYRGQEAEDSGFLYRGHEGEDSRRPLPWARGRRFRSPFTVGPRPKTPVALYRGPEADDFRRPLLWARGRRFPSPLTVGTRAKSCRLYREQAYRGPEGGDSRRLHREQELRARLLPWGRGRRFPSPFTVGPRAEIPVALHRGHEAEDCRRPLPWARGCRFPTMGPRLRIAVALYRGHEGEDPRRLLPWARGRRFPSPFTVGPRL